MKSSKLLLKLAAVAALASAGSAHAVTELVTNGSFEVDTISSSWAHVSTVTGWTSSVSGNTAFEIQKGATQGGEGGFNTTAAQGVQYLELNTDRLSTISQSIATTTPGLYSLSFSYSGRPGSDASGMNVYWGNTLLTASPLVGNTGGTWQTYSISTLSALNPSTALRFESVGPTSNTNYGSYLDNVSVAAVAAVPEPETYAMMLLGLGLVGFAARRKKSA